MRADKLNVVEVFKTNVGHVKKAAMLLEKLAEHFPKHKINFDLSDCDKILRVEGKNISAKKIIELLNKATYQCEVLE